MNRACNSNNDCAFAHRYLELKEKIPPFNPNSIKETQSNQL